MLESLMDLSAPHLAVLPKSDGGVLSVLAGTDRPLSGREVARLSGGSRSTVARVLRRLAEHGVVKVQEAGAGVALLYSLNREHVASDPLVDLLDLRRRLFDRLAAEFDGWPLPPLHASVFGSAARGDGGTASDIDLFIVRPSTILADDAGWRSHIDRLPHLIVIWTGNHAGIAEVSVDDVARLEREGATIVEDLRRDAITLAGYPLRELLALFAA
jgi:DNA-binding transcriptional ArsR family regulator